MFQYYYELKTPHELPPTSRFIDPYDGHVYSPAQGESLDEFTKRIVDTRKESGADKIPLDQLSALIKVTLAETASKKDLQKYFIPTANIPGVRQILSLAKAVATQHVHSGVVSYLTRQNRADKCLACPFHKKRGTFGKTTNNLITKIAGLKELEQSEKEKSLGQCGMCGCSLPAKIRFDINSVLAGTSPENLESLLSVLRLDGFKKCWITSDALLELGGTKILESKLKAAGKLSLLEEYRAREKALKDQDGKD